MPSYHIFTRQSRQQRSLHNMLEQESQLLQSPNDKKSYRRVKLPNGLTCLLIHDPEIELSEGQDDSEVLWMTAALFTAHSLSARSISRLGERAGVSKPAGDPLSRSEIKAVSWLCDLFC